MNIINMMIDDLIPYENNPRVNDEAVKYVANSIKEFGFKVPIIVDKNNVIVAGHTRYKACKELDIKNVPVIIADDLNEEQIKAFRLADNKVSEKAEWNMELLEEELEQLGLNMGLFGFNDLEEISEEIERVDLSEDIMEKYEVIIIKCINEMTMRETYEKLTKEGYECQLSTL